MSKRVAWGVFLIIAGVLLFLNEMNLLDFGDLFSLYWPSILIILGLIGLLSRDSSKISNLVLIAIGLFFQLRKLGYINVSIWQVFWPSILIIIGLNIIFQKGTSKHKYEVDPEKWEKENIVNEDILDYFTILSGIKNANYSKNFKGGKLTALLAGIELDLRDAQIANDTAIISATAILGGVEIIVPPDWNVEVKARPVLGGVENKTKYNRDENAPTLKIDGLAILGGIEIK